MNGTTQPTEATQCVFFIPRPGDLSGLCDRCRKTEHEHTGTLTPEAEPKPAAVNGRTPGNYIAITNDSAGPFKFAIIAEDSFTLVAEVYARRHVNHLKAEDDPEAAANAKMFAAAPKLLDRGRTLSDYAKRLNDLQHSGQEIDPSMWGELYQLVNEMRAAVEEAEEKP
jgi:hypothetical protein